MEPTKKFKIFMVDDESFCLNLYKQYFNNLGYDDVTSFNNGPDCLNYLTLQPDVIFLDYGMYDLTGIDVLKKIKRFNPDIFVVFLSGQENIDTAVNALKFGAFDYIVKGTGDMLKLTKVLNKINDVKELMKAEGPTLINKLFSFLQ
jgi:DNA-binding NtrC family response regulator